MAVCLHCLHEARVAARERRQRIIVRFSLWMLGIAVVGAVGVSATTNALRHPAPPPVARGARPGSRPRRATAPPSRDSLVTVASAMPVIPQGSADTTRPTVHDSSRAPAATPAAPVPATTDSAHVPQAVIVLRTVLPVGRTELPDSLFAERSGDTVHVHFDTSPMRTRRADKFDRIVRQTLRAVYGSIADTLLATVPEGRLAAPNELLTDLPARGIHLATPDGRRIALWPETRPGRDGPLVVAYRTIVER